MELTMGRILAIDYGMKRTGLAVTDPLKIIATGLETVETTNLVSFLQKYFQKETVDEVIIGLPRQLNNQDSETAPNVRKFIAVFQNTFPGKPIIEVDERNTTVMAHAAMIEGGMKKSDRQIKGNADRISATLILQNYMMSRK